MASAEEQARADWPEFGLVDDIRPALAAALSAGEPSALVTLYAAEGGAPRGIGAQMLITQRSVTGYVGGGCVEADIVLHALETIADGTPRRLIYGLGGPIDIKLPCGGWIGLLVERLAADDLAAHRLVALREARRPALWLSDGTRHVCIEPAAESPPAEWADACRAAEAGPLAGEADGGLVWRKAMPQRRLVVIGADPVTLALCRLGAEMGMEVALVRPKGPEAPPARAALRYLRDDPAAALQKIGVDPFTAVVVAMHDADHDHEALAAALPSPAFYVGLLGSRRKLADKLARLRTAGLAEADLARLKAPVGLPLGGRAPWEIAVAIIGEVVQTAQARRQRAARTEAVVAA